MYISLGASFHHFAYNCKSVARSSVPQAREIETLVKDRLLVPQAHEMETLAKDRSTYQVLLVVFPLPPF